MLVYESAKGMHDAAETARRHGQKLAFIPTMGALHEGHRSLFREARRRGDFRVVSLFVNPTQFNTPEDFEKYPRNLEADLALCEGEGIDLVFHPTVAEIYPDGFKETPSLPRVAIPMEGEFRPSHFAGICSVVTRLFQIVQPETALFGEKDFQQLRVIEEMVCERRIPVRIVRCPTVRNSNGFALSSRNALLSAKGYEEALAIPRAIRAVQKNLNLDAAHQQLEKLKVDYLTIADAETLQPVKRPDRPGRIFIAAWVEGVRLIDNQEFSLTASRDTVSPTEK